MRPIRILGIWIAILAVGSVAFMTGKRIIHAQQSTSKAVEGEGVDSTEEAALPRMKKSVGRNVAAIDEGEAAAPVEAAQDKAEVTKNEPQPQTEDWQAVVKVVLVYFQDTARRAIEGVMIDTGGDTWIVTGGNAGIAPQGITQAIDRVLVEYAVGELHTSTVEEAEHVQTHDVPGLIFYRLPERLTKYRLTDKVDPETLPKAVVGDLLIAQHAHFPANRPCQRRSTKVKVAALNSAVEIKLDDGTPKKFSDLIQLSGGLPEGTPVFKQGRLAGITVVGTRFSGKPNVSYAMPIERIRQLSRRAFLDFATDDTEAASDLVTREAVESKNLNLIPPPADPDVSSISRVPVPTPAVGANTLDTNEPASRKPVSRLEDAKVPTPNDEGPRPQSLTADSFKAPVVEDANKFDAQSEFGNPRAALNGGQNPALDTPVATDAIREEITPAAEETTSASISIPAGTRVATVPVKLKPSESGTIKAGDLVDVKVSYRVRPPGNGDYPETKTILGNIQVLATGKPQKGNSVAGGAHEIETTVSLLVTPEQAHIVTQALSIGTLSLVLRHPGDAPDAKVADLIPDVARKASGRTVITLNHLDPNDTAKTLTSLFGDSADGQGLVRIASNASSRTIIISAPNESIEQIQLVIAELEKHAELAEKERLKLTHQQPDPAKAQTQGLSFIQQALNPVNAEDAALGFEAAELASQIVATPGPNRDELLALEELTNRHFDLRQQIRLQEIDALAGRVEQMRTAHARRNEQKAHIVKRRLAELLNEYTELDWETKPAKATTSEPAPNPKNTTDADLRKRVQAKVIYQLESPEGQLKLAVGDMRYVRLPNRIKSVDGFNDKLLKLSTIPGEAQQVRVEGLGAGSTQIVLKDNFDQLYVIEVQVEGDARQSEPEGPKPVPETGKP